jgi:hypothetical protein
MGGDRATLPKSYGSRSQCLVPFTTQKSLSSPDHSFRNETSNLLVNSIQSQYSLMFTIMGGNNLKKPFPIRLFGGWRCSRTFIPQPPRALVSSLQIRYFVQQGRSKAPQTYPHLSLSQNSQSTTLNTCRGADQHSFIRIGR